MSAVRIQRLSRSRPSALVLAAGVLVAAGAVVSGWVGWQLWGTTAVSQQRHDQVAEELQQAWGGARGGAGEELVATEFGSASAIVRIPAFGSDYAVPVLEGTTDEVLAAGFGHRDGTAAAGGRGNYVIAGHRITHGEPLRDMPHLKAGDEVIVETRDATYTYVLDTPGDGLTVTDHDTWVADAVPVADGPPSAQMRRSGRLLTLITCADFTGSPDRLVAFGHLDTVEPKP